MNKQNVYAVYNWKLFKLIGIYQIVDPDSKKIFGFNIYHLVNVVFIIFTTSMMILGSFGFFYKEHKDTYNNSDTILMIFFTVISTIANFKMTIIIFNARKLWDVFEITYESFLSNSFYKRNFYQIVNCGRLLSKLFGVYVCFIYLTATLYTTVPMVLNTRPVNNTTQHNNTETIRKANILNMKYPFTTETYNAYFRLFYATECVIVYYSAFGAIALDLFLMTFLMVISAQYKLIASAFEALEHCRMDNRHDCFLNDEKFLEQLMSIVSDSQIIYKKLKVFYDIIRPVGLVQMIADASGMIFMPYLLVLYFEKYGTLFNPETLKLVFTLGFAGMQSYVYCSLFQLVTDRQDAVNFGLYCCDWTGMDIRAKKLILLIMQINNSNTLKMNVTPSESIDLPLLSKIIRLSYRVLSVMINTNINNSKHLR